jgi:hypothetical protein
MPIEYIWCIGMAIIIVLFVIAAIFHSKNK